LNSTPYSSEEYTSFDASTLMPELATNNIFRNGNGDTDSP
jgi:hypothetical protein